MFPSTEAAMKLNTKRETIKTHEGGTAKRINPEMQLRRSVMACMLWEGTFYEDGQEIAQRIHDTVPLVEAEKVAELAIEARAAFKLRHVPLLLVREMCRHQTHRPLVAKTLEAVIQRADELTEFMACYWIDGREKIAAQVKKGLARAFTKFSAHDLAKYDRDGAVKLRDVLFLVHAKPKDEAQAAVWRQLIARELPVPDTWETALSSGADKLQTWRRLLAENKLGALALLRNLRNMAEAGVKQEDMERALAAMRVERVLPYRFIAAARHAPDLEPALETAMYRCVDGAEKLCGHTVLLVDVSGSMNDLLGGRSEMSRADAACGLAILLREICERITVATFSNNLVPVPPRRGFALRDAIVGSQEHSGTYLGAAVTNLPDAADRVIVITDEQSADAVPDPRWPRSYMVNVAAYKNGVGYGKWVHITGWSEAIVRFIQEYERGEDR